MANLSELILHRRKYLHIRIFRRRYLTLHIEFVLLFNLPKRLNVDLLKQFMWPYGIVSVKLISLKTIQVSMQTFT